MKTTSPWFLKMSDINLLIKCIIIYFNYNLNRNTFQPTFQENMIGFQIKKMTVTEQGIDFIHVHCRGHSIT